MSVCVLSLGKIISTVPKTAFYWLWLYKLILPDNFPEIKYPQMQLCNFKNIYNNFKYLKMLKWIYVVNSF